MILWLDHKIFGNGYGLGSPYFDGKFYWLNGELYTFMQGSGAQLHSIQWTHPNAGEERKLFGYRFRPLHSHRRFLWLFKESVPIPLPISRVIVAWSRVDLPKDIDEANAELRHMATQVGESHPHERRVSRPQRTSASSPSDSALSRRLLE